MSSLRISEQTLKILKNLSSISTTFLHDPTIADGKLRAVHPNQNLSAFAKVPEVFPEFYLFDLRAFLSFLDLLPDGELEFTDKAVIARKGKSKGTFVFCSKELVLTPPKNIRTPPADVEVTLTAAQIQSILKASNTLGVSDIVVSCEGNGASIEISTEAQKNSGNDNKFSLELDFTHTEKFRFVFSADIVKFIPCDYRVRISKLFIAEFHANLSSGGEYQITYWVSLDKSSTFGVA